MNSVGIWFVYKNIERAQKYKEYFMCGRRFDLFSFINRISSSRSKNLSRRNCNAGCFVFMFFSNKLIKHKPSKESLAFGILAIEGIGIHSFIDGIIYSVTFS